MTEWEKAQKGYLYDANYDKEIVESRTRCADLCYEFNNLRPSDIEKQQELLKKILGKMEGMPVITAPFYCDYGINTSCLLYTSMLPNSLLNNFTRRRFWTANIFSAPELPNLRQISFTTRLFLGIFMAIMSSAAQFPLK